MKTGVVLIAAFVVLLSTYASAEEGISECASSDARQMTLYNPAHLEAVFGTAPVCENGLVHIKTTIGEGRRTTEWDIGWLYGDIETREGSKIIAVNDGGFISGAANPAEAKINVSGGEIILDATDRSKLTFETGRGIYSKYSYSVVCKGECAMKSLLSPSMSYLNLSGQATAIYAGYLNDYISGKQLDSKALIKISDLDKISIRNFTRFEISALAHGRSLFGDIAVIANEEIGLRRFYSVNLNPAFVESGAGSTEYMDIVFAKQADVFAEAGHNIGMATYEYRGEPDYELSLFIGNSKLFEINIGAFMLLKDRVIYDACAKGAINDLEFDSGICAYISGQSLKINPGMTKLKWETQTESGEVIGTGERKFPFQFKIHYAMNSPYNQLELLEFERQDTTSRVRIEKEGAAGSMTFSRDDVVMEGGANWYDFGTSFKSLVYDAERNFYSLFECALDTKECYLDGTLVSGEFRRMGGRLERCNENSDCGEGRQCRQKLCVRQAGCQQLTNVNAGRNSANAVDIVFVSDRYMNESDFTQDVGYAVNGDGTHIGILTVEPFSLQKEKFNIWSIYTGETMLPIEAGPFGDITPAEKYVNAMGMNCPFGDRIITLSGLNFRDFAQFGGNAYVSRTGDGDWFGAYAVHEFGHSFGQLQDEYNQSKGNQAGGCYAGPPNCVVSSAAANTYGWTEEIAAEAVSNNWRGCGGDCGNWYVNNLRPSFNSIMRYPAEEGGDVFNPPSVAWVQRILGRY